MHTCYDCYQGNENVSRVWLGHDFILCYVDSLSITRWSIKSCVAEKPSYCRYVWTNTVSFWFAMVLVLLYSYVYSSSSYSSIFNFRYWNFRSIRSSLEFSLSRSTSSALSHFLSLSLSLSRSLRRTALPPSNWIHTVFNQSRSDHCKTNNNKTKSEQNEQ